MQRGIGDGRREVEGKAGGAAQTDGIRERDVWRIPAVGVVQSGSVDNPAQNAATTEEVGHSYRGRECDRHGTKRAAGGLVVGINRGPIHKVGADRAGGEQDNGMNEDANCFHGEWLMFPVDKCREPNVPGFNYCAHEGLHLMAFVRVVQLVIMLGSRGADLVKFC